MNKILKNEEGFSLVEALILILLVAIICASGWLVYKRYQNGQVINTLSTPSLSNGANTSGWQTYNNSCFKYSFKAPADLKVKILNNPTTVSCGLVPTDIGSYGVSDWASVSATIGNSYVESLPKGPYLDLLTPTPINNPTAMSFIGLEQANTVSSVLGGIVSSTDKNSKASLVIINGHQAALVKTVNPDNPPSNFRTVDTPYCPCTSEEVTFDTGGGSVLRVTAIRLNSDKQAGQIIDGIIESLKFQ